MKIQPLQAKAVELIRRNPEMDIHAFSKLIGKNYNHAASLMSYARKQLGNPARERPTKVDKTMALIHLGMKVKGQPFRDRLEVKACRASELRHLARQRLEQGKMPTDDAIAWALSAEGQKTGKSDDPINTPKQNTKKSTPAIRAEKTTSGAMSVQSVQKRPRSPDDLIRASGLDPEEWFVASQIVNSWEIGAKHPDTGEILVEPLFQTKVRLEPIAGIEGAASLMKELFDELRENPISFPKIQRRQIEAGHLAEIAIPDLHLGKFASARETGEAYNPELACQIFNSAIDDLLGQVISAYPVEKIVFPIGNDFLTADNSANTTTRGTAQDVAGNFEAHFRLGWKLLLEGIEKLRSVAPVEVVIVPGNHDSVASFALGQLLGALHENSDDVVVHHQSDAPRKYISYGLNLLGYAHGHLERGQSLPMLMATEAPHEWGKSRHREIHVGHLHHTRDTHFLGTNEEHGVILRVIPSLSAADRWHAAKGYRSQRAALAMVYHPTLGQRAIFRHSILDALQVAVPRIA